MSANVPVGDIINFLDIMQRFEGEIRLVDKERNLYESFRDIKGLKELIIHFSKYAPWQAFAGKPTVSEEMFDQTKFVYFIANSFHVDNEWIHESMLKFKLTGEIYCKHVLDNGRIDESQTFKLDFKVTSETDTRGFFGFIGEWQKR